MKKNWSFAFAMPLFFVSMFSRLAAAAQQADIGKITALSHDLIEAENTRNESFVMNLVWDSPNALFVAKTKAGDARGWAGFWGADIVRQHLHDVINGGTFRIDPDYDSERVVLLSPNVGQTYLPVKISVSYAGQNPQPRPFLLILLWRKTKSGWKMASDIAIPVPQS
jgi:hypothetical protein